MSIFFFQLNFKLSLGFMSSEKLALPSAHMILVMDFVVCELLEGKPSVTWLHLHSLAHIRNSMKFDK